MKIAVQESKTGPRPNNCPPFTMSNLKTYLMACKRQRGRKHMQPTTMMKGLTKSEIRKSKMKSCTYNFKTSLPI